MDARLASSTMGGRQLNFYWTGQNVYADRQELFCFDVQ